MPTSVQTTRLLGEQERLLNYLHGYGGLIVMQVLHIRGRLDAKSVRNSLNWLQRRYPMARAHVRYGGLVFRKYPPFVYRQPRFELEGTGKIALRVTENDWQQVLAEELRKPLPRGRTPRMRLTMVNDPEEELTHLLLSADHSSVDAQSCNLLARELLQHLADPAAMDAQEPRERGLPPPLEARLQRQSNNARSPYQAAIRLPKGKKERGRAATRVVKRAIAPEQLKRLKEAALENRASLHGALAAAFLLAIRDKHGLSEMTCLSSVDMRRMCKPQIPAETFGCYLDILRTRHELEKDFWPLARDVSFRIISTLSRNREAASLLKLPDWEIYAREGLPTMVSGRRIDGLAITTAGSSGLEQDYGHLRLEDVTMAVSLDTFGPGVLVISCERLGGLDLSICYATRATCKQDVQDITGRALKHLAAHSIIEKADA